MGQQCSIFIGINFFPIFFACVFFPSLLLLSPLALALTLSFCNCVWLCIFLSYRYTCRRARAFFFSRPNPPHTIFFPVRSLCFFLSAYTFVPFFSRAHIRSFFILAIAFIFFFFPPEFVCVCALDFYICPVDFGMCWFMCANAQFGIIITMMENKAAITKMSTNNDYSMLLQQQQRQQQKRRWQQPRQQQ